MSASMHVAALTVAQGLEPLPATSPIGGWVWVYVVPAVLLVSSFLATWALYRKFSGPEDQSRP